MSDPDKQASPCDCTTKDVQYTSIIEGVMVAKSYSKRVICDYCKAAAKSNHNSTQETCDD